MVSVSKFWSLLDSLRGVMQIEESLEALVALAVIAKVMPEEFYEIYKAPMALQQKQLLSLIKTHPSLKSLDTLDSLVSKFLTPEALQKMIYAVNEFSDFAALADDMLDLISSTQGKKGAEFITAFTIIEIIKQLAGDVSHSKTYDGAAGLCALTSQLNTDQLVLEDINSSAWSLGKNILLLKGINADYRLNNSLLDLQPSACADLVITQPPWGLRLSSNERNELKNAKFLQFDKGEKIPSSASDALWIQHSLYNLNESGRAIMLMPQGWLFRGGYDARLRAFLLEYDLIEAIVGLPSGLLHHTSIPSVILVLNKNKQKNQKGVVNFVDASQLGSQDNRKKVLSSKEINLIVVLTKGEKPNHEYFKAVLLPEIHQNENNLNIKEYIQQVDEYVIPNLKEERKKLEQAQASFDSAQATLINLLAEQSSAKSK